MKTASWQDHRSWEIGLELQVTALKAVKTVFIGDIGEGYSETGLGYSWKIDNT